MPQAAALPSARPSRRSLLFSGLALGLGARLGSAILGPKGPGARSSLVWVADRQADRLVELDQGLGVRSTLPIESPRRLGWAGGVLWGASGGLRPRLLSWRADSHGRWRAQCTLGLGPIRQLWALPSGAALVLLEAGGHWRLSSVDGAGALSELLRLEAGARGVLGRGGLLCHLGPSGQWLSYGVNQRGVRLLATAWERQGVAHALRAEDGGWWCLRGKSGTRLERRDAQLRQLWSRPLGMPAERLLPAGDGVLAVGGKRLSSQRVDPAGRADPPCETGVRGPLRAAASCESGYLLALSGAILRLSPGGEVLATQGGFGALSDLAVT